MASLESPLRTLALPSRWDGRLAFAAAAVLLPLLLTYFLTSLRAHWIKNVRRKGDPPPAPYTVPILGNTLQFAFDTEGFLARTLKRFGSVPFRLSVGLENMYYIPHGEPIRALFKNTRELASKPIIIVAMRDQFGMPPEDLAIFQRDGSGPNAKPLDGWEHMDPAHRIFHSQHRDLNALLNGPSLDAMTVRFIGNYTARLRTTTLVGDEWTELPDLFVFLRDEMFHAACLSLLGEHFFELCPDFGRDFWDFDKSVLTFLRRTPRCTAPGTYAVRDRLLASMKKWRQHAKDHLDHNDPSLAGVEYEPIWGARLMRARAEMFDKAGASADGSASMDLGLLWATNANVIPSAAWVLLNILLSPNLAERALAETAASFDDAADSFDVPALCSKPLLNGLYLEALRFCVSTATARNPVADNFKLCGWSMPRDSLMLSIGWFGAHDPSFWNTGRTLPNGEPEHPVNAYWPERFLEYPDDPASGPVRKPDDEAIYRSSVRKRAQRTAEDDKAANVVNHTAVLQGNFYPYGGGNRICPGRHFAKQELLSAVAVMLREFEIELLDPASARSARPDLTMFASGALGPDRKLPVRIRRRK